MMRRLSLLGFAILAACSPRHAIPPARTPPPPPPIASTPLPPSRPAPPPKPAWVARKVVADAVTVGAQTIVVQDGDGLGRIANRTGASVEAIAKANGLAPPYPVKLGQRLAIPAGRYHSVKAGETGIAIARAYGIPWSRIIAENALAEPYVLRAGQRLKLTADAPAGPRSMEDRARAFQLNIDDLITGGEPAAASAAAPTPRAASRPTPAKPLPPTTPVAEPAVFAGRFAWPIQGRILSGYGPKESGRFNDGINIKADEGAAVRAAADGVVAYAGDAIAGFGGLILIKHGDGWVTAYGHNQAMLVTRGQTVRKGDIIARAGETGSVDEPQVHFEIRQGRKAVNPVQYLPRS